MTENLSHPPDWMDGYAAGRDDGYEIGYQDGTEDGMKPPVDERIDKGEPHSVQNLDARLYRLEKVMAALLHELGYRAE